MKKTLVLMGLVLALSLILVHTQALAISLSSGSPAAPKKTPGPPGLPDPTETLEPGQPPPAGNPGPPAGMGPQHTPGAQATAHAGIHGKPTIFHGTLGTLSPSSLTLTLDDGSSVTIGLTADTRIKVPGPKAQGDVLLVGMRATVMAFTDSSDALVARSVMVIPGQPVRAHRVGTVTAYSAGASITILATDGSSYTFALTAGTVILPAARAAQLAVGSRVTIIAPRDPSTLGGAATGIVIHPPKP
jgi:hypothetical protein